MSEKSLNNMVNVTMDNLKDLVDVNTIIGTPIKLDNGVTIIPVSKVSYGFATGGSEFAGKKENTDNLFGGGSGAGVTISPIAFLSVSQYGDVKILYAEENVTTASKVIDMMPDMVDKVGEMFKKEDKDKKILNDDEKY